MLFRGMAHMAEIKIDTKRTSYKGAFKKITSLGAVFTFALSLSACRPMYGETSMGANATYELSSISVNTIPGRVGQQIRNQLVFLFTGGNRAAAPNYKLDVIYRKSVVGVLFKRSEDAAGQILSIDATFILRELNGEDKSKNILLKSKSHARAAFDKHFSTYSNVRAKRDAENRAAKDIANDINTRISAYISSHR